MRQGKWCLRMALSHTKIYRLHSMHYFNMQSVHCSLPHLYGNSLCPKIRKSLNRVNGVGNGITDPRHGYRIGQICQMQAMGARYYFIVVARSHVRATANASEPEFGCSQLYKCDGSCTNNVTCSWTTVKRMYQICFKYFAFFQISKESVLVVYISPHNFSFSKYYSSACADKHMNWHHIIIDRRAILVPVRRIISTK